MTKGRFYFLLFVLAAVLFVVFVWPTPERLAEIRFGPKSDSTSTVEYDGLRDSPSGRGVQKARQAADDMKKMNEAVQKATEH